MNTASIPSIRNAAELTPFQSRYWNELRRKTGSWVVVDRKTGEVTMETFQASVAEKVNREKYDVLPIQDYLAGLNEN